MNIICKKWIIKLIYYEEIIAFVLWMWVIYGSVYFHKYIKLREYGLSQYERWPRGKTFSCYKYCENKTKRIQESQKRFTTGNILKE